MESPVRPEILVSTASIVSGPHWDNWEGEVYPLTKTQDSEKHNGQRYMAVYYAGSKLDLSTATYINSTFFDDAEKDAKGNLCISPSALRLHDTKTPLSCGDMEWAQKTLDWQRSLSSKQQRALFSKYREGLEL